MVVPPAFHRFVARLGDVIDQGIDAPPFAMSAWLTVVLDVGA
jgi:hypothetical protein